VLSVPIIRDDTSRKSSINPTICFAEFFHKKRPFNGKVFVPEEGFEPS
jgi:hypothetical protein